MRSITKTDQQAGLVSMDPTDGVGRAALRRLRVVPLALALLAGCALFWSATAQAKVVHVFAESFGGEGSFPGQFEGARAVAVNDTTHDVYVVDVGNDRVQEFNSTGSEVIREFNGSSAPTGAFEEPGTIAIDNSAEPLVDPSAGDVYVADVGHRVIDKFTETGVYLGQVTETPSGTFAGTPGSAVQLSVAIDPHGELWVAYHSASSGEVAETYSFNDALANEYLSARTTELGEGRSFAVDSNDDLYLYQNNIRGNVHPEGVVLKTNSSGETLLGDQFAYEGEALGVAVDSTGNEIYVDQPEWIDTYDSNGDLIERFGSGDLTDDGTGVAVDNGNGMVYVADGRADQVVAFNAVHVPTVGMTPVSEQEPRSLTLNGTVNPEGELVASCVFEYDTRAYEEGEAPHGTRVPCEPSPGEGAGQIGKGTKEVPVSAHLTSLTPGLKYHYRLVAENTASIASSTADREVTAGPVLGGESVTDVTSSGATLQAQVDPNGADTHYYFQYGTTTSYGSEAPVSAPGADIGSAAGSQELGWRLQGLEAGTVYHYRVVVMQDGEAFEEADRTFTTELAGLGSGLPDGRMWELVSPADKNGALIEPGRAGILENSSQIQAAADGSGVTYVTFGPHVGEDPKGNMSKSQVLSRRGAASWSTVDLTLPAELPENEEPATAFFAQGAYPYPLFSPDLSQEVVEPRTFATPLLSPEATERTLYLRDTGNGGYRPLVTQADLPPGVKGEESGIKDDEGKYEWEQQFLAATPDLGHVIFKTPLALTENAIDDEVPEVEAGEHQWNLYEWGGGSLRLVNVLPDGEAAHGTYPSSVRLAGMVSSGESAGGGVQRAVSNDGRRVAWTLGDPYDANVSGYNGLFVRDMVEERTVKVGGGSARFQTMSNDGSNIFYLEGGDLYDFDYETGTSTDLSGVHGLGENSAGVKELVSDVSEDGSYVYFVATGVLAVGARAGEDNLYVAHDTGSGWTTTLVATLSPDDEPSWYAKGFYGAPDLSRISSRVSPNGRFLAFMSDRSLTGYDNTDVSEEETEEYTGGPKAKVHHDEEVYEYDAETNRLVCASCDPTGARPVGVFDGADSELLVDGKSIWLADRIENPLATNHWLAGNIPGWDYHSKAQTTYQPRYLSDNGRLFFNSPDALVPRDTDGLEDVYEYESEHVGGCEGPSGATGFIVFKSAHTFEVEGRKGEEGAGCVGLISGGTSSAESVFYDASETGDDVFFDTTGKLSGEDYDQAYDVYDAHVCSAMVPCRSTPVSPPPCASGDSCKAAPTPQPEIFGPPPSETFNGAGDIPSSPFVPKAAPKKLTRCKKGFVRKRGKCVKSRDGKKKTRAKKSAHVNRKAGR